jgi:hypothetical protein
MARILLLVAVAAVVLAPAAFGSDTQTNPVGPAASVYVEQIPSASGKAQHPKGGPVAVSDSSGGGTSLPVSLLVVAAVAGLSLAGAVAVKAARSRRRAH